MSRVRVASWFAFALACCVGIALLLGSKSRLVQQQDARKADPNNPDKPDRVTGPAQIRGVVTRESNQERLSGALLDFRVEKVVIATVFSDSQGKYEIALEPDEYEVWAKLHPQAISRLVQDHLSISPGEQRTLDITLPVGPAVSGRVRTWDGKVPAEIQLEVDWRGKPAIAERRHCRLNEAGQFRVILERSEGSSTLYALASGYPRSDPVQLDFSRHKDIEGLEITFGIGTGLQGKVVNQDRLPVANAKVFLEVTPKEAPRIAALTDGQGGFSFPALRTGEYIATVDAEGYILEPQAEKIRIQAGFGIGNLTLTVREGWKISGKVIDSQGQPISACSIRVLESGLAYAGQGSKQGLFVVNRIKPGDQHNTNNKHQGIDSVMCTAKDFAPITYIDVTPGDSLTFVMHSGGTLEVKLRLGEGEVPRFFPWSVTLDLRESQLPSDKSPNTATRIAHPAEGQQTVLHDLAPGFYDIEVGAFGRKPVKRERVPVVAKETTTIEVTLFPGGGGVIASTLVMDKETNPERFRTQVALMLQNAEQQERQYIIKDLLEDTQDLPVLRRIVEELIKK